VKEANRMFFMKNCFLKQRYSNIKLTLIYGFQ